MITNRLDKRGNREVYSRLGHAFLSVTIKMRGNLLDRGRLSDGLQAHRKPRIHFNRYFHNVKG